MRKFSTYNGLFLGKPPIIKDNSTRAAPPSASPPNAVDDNSGAIPHVEQGVATAYGDYISDYQAPLLQDGAAAYDNYMSDYQAPLLTRKALGCLTTIREHDRAVKELLGK